MIDVPFRPDRTSREPVYRQLAGCLRGLIETGRLGGGQKLPASRELAAGLGLSRTTVAQAYDDLVAAGLLNAHVGQGTFVALHIAPHATRPPAGRAFVWAGLFSARARALTLPVGLISAPKPRYDFRGGRVDGASLPVAALRRALADAVAGRLEEIAAQEDPFGWLPLRREVARHLIGRGIRCEPEDVAIVNGAQHAIELTARVLLDPGDTAVIEQPGYFGAAMVFAAAQANVVGVGVDDEGLRADELARVLQARRVKLIYATPAVQNPTGVTLSDARRAEILDLVDHHQAPLLEDDYTSELRYGEPPIAALKTSDTGGQIVYVGTFSKVLFPTLRVGFVVAARPLLRKMVLARMAGDFATSMPAQVAVAEMLRSGALDRHVRRVRRLYGRRLRALLTALSCTMPEGVRWTEPKGGHILWLTLPTNGDAIFREASAAGIAYSSGTAFHVDGQGAEHVALSFACMPSSRIAEGVDKLAAIVRRHSTSEVRAMRVERGASRGQRRAAARRV